MSSPEFTDSAVDVNVDVSGSAPSFTELSESFEFDDEEEIVLKTSSQAVSKVDGRPDTTAQDLERDGYKSHFDSQVLDHATTVSENSNENGEVADNNHGPRAQYPHGQALENIGNEHKQDGIGLYETGNEIIEADIFRVHDNLAEVVASMRLRQQEQRHLHELTVQKVEAVAQRCLFQEQQIQEMLEEIKSLRAENQTLGHENDKLRDTVVELEAETSKKEIAVSAMTSAVAGLEGWIGDAEKARMESVASVAPVRDGRPRRAVIRGKGRFRGRHYIDHEHDQPNIDPDTQELQEGVKAWIRGFRDVEDACNSALTGRMKELYREPATVEEDDWGDFQTPSGTVR